MKKLLTSSVLATAISVSANAEENHNHHDHSTRAPAGVMGAHLMEEGDLMLSYRFGRMGMRGNRTGTDSVTPQEVLADPRFMVTPLQMNMEMHMLGAMYGLTEDITLMAMTSYQRRVMGHRTGMGAEFTTESQGFGDTRLTGLFKHNDNLHFTAGLSIPTGSISQRDQTPAGESVLPFPMQLGSGTFDPIIGVTYQEHLTDFSWGSQANATFRLYDNNQDYNQGNEYNITAWISKPLDSWITGSLRLDGSIRENYDGFDDRVGAIVPTAFPNLRGGERVDLLVGFNINPEEFAAPINVEFGIPIYQRLEGPQLQTQYRLFVGTEFVF